MNSAPDQTEAAMSSLGKRLSDYFVIAGLDEKSGLEVDQLSSGNLSVAPLLRPYKSRIISHYPHYVPWNRFDADAVCMMCFPGGLSFTTSKKPPPLTVHPFIITREDSSKVFGVCLTFYEEVLDDKICQAMAQLQVMYSTEVDEPTDLSPLSPRQQQHMAHSVAEGDNSPSPSNLDSGETKGRCPSDASVGRGVVADTPHYSRSVDRLYVTKAICLLMQQPYYTAGERVLRHLYGVSRGSVASKLPLESYVYNVLYEVPVPSPGRSLSFALGDDRGILQSPGSLELPILDMNFAKVCKTLGLNNLVDIMTCAFLENRILLYSSEYNDLMTVAECLTALLFPFSWQHVYVPILPASHQTFLDAPVPYIMGIYCESMAQLSDRPAGVCFVDLDAQTVDLPEELPAFPHKKELIEEIQDMAQQFKVDLICAKQDPDCNENSTDDSGMSSTDDSLSGGEEASSDAYSFLQHSEAIAQITAIATRSGVIESFADFKESFVNESRTKKLQKQREASRLKKLQGELRLAKFSAAAREVFLNQMMHLFASYEKFVIQPPSSDMDSWLTNREVMQNFDKETFLCDQPEAYLPFLCSFIESQMFTTFIDNKILSNWEDTDANVYIFDNRLSKLLDKPESHTPTYHRCSSLDGLVAQMEKRILQVDSAAPAPHALEGVSYQQGVYEKGPFPQLCERILNNQPSRTPRGGDRLVRRRESVMLPDREQRRRESQILANPEGSGETQWKFVSTLLRECKLKTKRILVDKMGHEAEALGHGGDAGLPGMEESTLIASLCDLLERIWSHGLVTKRGKSCLWQHLKAYVELEDMNDKNKRVDTFRGTQPQAQPSVLPALFYHATINVLRDLKVHQLLEDAGAGGRGKKKGTAVYEDRPKTLEPLSGSLSHDFKTIDKIKEFKTDVGKARAWVRLCLEKKTLAAHLRELLSEVDLARNLYKRYSFIRCDDEREQAIFHLLSLEAADFYCFTNNFTTAAIPYRVLIFPGKRFAGGYITTSANCWMVLAGQIRESGKLNIPRNANQFHFEGQNLGSLSTLRLGHDNTGISPKWLVDGILVRNEITGHMYKFICGRWLGKGVDDGSTERVLVGEQLPHGISVEDAMESCQNFSCPKKSGSPQLPRRPSDCKLGRSELQHILKDAINSLIKYFCRPEKERGSITVLLCGDYGLVNCLDMMFQSGFKSTRLFRNNLYVWDYFERVTSYLKDKNLTIPGFCAYVDIINTSRSSIGKDGKFQQLMCLAIRDHLLTQWLPDFLECPVTAQMYEETAFLRDRDQVKHLVTTLTSLKEFKIKLEPSLTQGLLV